MWFSRTAQLLDSLCLQAEPKKAAGKDDDKGEPEEKWEEQKEDQCEPIILSVRDVWRSNSQVVVMSLWGLEGNLLNARPFLGCEGVRLLFSLVPSSMCTSVVPHQHCNVLLYNKDVSIASIAPFISYPGWHFLAFSSIPSFQESASEASIAEGSDDVETFVPATAAPGAEFAFQWENAFPKMPFGCDVPWSSWRLQRSKNVKAVRWLFVFSPLAFFVPSGRDTVSDDSTFGWTATSLGPRIQTLGGSHALE